MGIIIGLAGLFLYQGIKDGLLDDLDNILLEIADRTSDFWRAKRGVTWEDAMKKAEAEYISYQPFIQLVQIAYKGDEKIERVTRSPRIPEDVFKLRTRLYYEAERSDINELVFETVTDDRLSPFPIRVFLYPERGPNILQVGISLERTVESLNRLLMVMVFVGLMVLLLASLGGGFILKTALQPVKNAVKTTQEITAEDLSLRIDTKHRKDEIGELISTFNDMIARLEKSVGKIRQFSGDVSHELRTPLTIIRGETEVLLRKDRPKEEYVKTLKSVMEESQLMQKIIDDLLFLSRIEALDKTRLNETVSLDEIVVKAVESRTPAGKNKGLQLIVEKMDSLQIKGNKNLLERMITNVIDNAIRYTPSPGQVEVLLAKDKGQAHLDVRDTGIGIPAKSLLHIFDRFFVVDKSRSKEIGGTGLGLSIVKWIADSHHAVIDVKSQVNEGTTFRITFHLTKPWLVNNPGLV